MKENKYKFICEMVLMLLVLGINESQPASMLKTTKQVTDAINSDKRIFLKPKISIGHHGLEDKQPLEPSTAKPLYTYNSTSVQDSNSEEEKKVALLGNTSTLHQLRLSQREARLIIGALDRKTCFAKLLCGLGSKEPTKNTDLMNDYAYLLGELMLNSEEDTGQTKPASSSILADIWDEFSTLRLVQPKQDDDDKSDEEDDDEINRSGLGLGQDDGDGYIRLRPFHYVRPVIQHPIGVLLRRREKQQSQRRQCRQIRESYKCPYDDSQMSKIVSKLRGVLRGEDLLGTIATGGSQLMASIQRPPDMSSPGKMNLVINLQHNFPTPQQQMTGFAALPLTVSSLQSIQGSSSVTVRSNETHGVNNEAQIRQDNADTFKPFYILPLVPETTSTVPTQATIPTTSVDPLQQLVGFLYSVGYANNGTGNSIPTPPVAAAATASTTNFVDTTDEDNSEEQLLRFKDLAFLKSTIREEDVEEDGDQRDTGDAYKSEEVAKTNGKPGPHTRRQGQRRKVPISSSFERASNLVDRNTLEQNEELEDDDNFVRIKPSLRSGRFQVNQGDGGGPHYLEVGRPHLPLYAHKPGESFLVRALRLFSSILRGGPLG